MRRIDSTLDAFVILAIGTETERNAISMTNVGVCYKKGNGVEKDVVKAVEFGKWVLKESEMINIAYFETGDDS